MSTRGKEKKTWNDTKEKMNVVPYIHYM